jgi:membrane-associated protein
MKEFVFDLLLHLDKHLADLTASYGTWTYAILFVVVFCETGLVVTPLLPGDSLLFAAGAICSLGSLNVGVLWLLLVVAAIAGDSANYQIGYYLGPKVLRGEHSRLFNKKHLDRTHAFFEKYGGATIIIARFVPIVRTFAPFVAGVGAMTYRRFLAYNVIGGVAWVSGFLFAGYWFGNIPWVKANFSSVILAIIVVSVLPMVYEYVRQTWLARASGRKTSAAPGARPTVGDLGGADE